VRTAGACAGSREGQLNLDGWRARDLHVKLAPAGPRRRYNGAMAAMEERRREDGERGRRRAKRKRRERGEATIGERGRARGLGVRRLGFPPKERRGERDP
jgi:hypothetical protein